MTLRTEDEGLPVTIMSVGETALLPFAEGARIEPFSVGMHAAIKAKIAPGGVAVVVGAGTMVSTGALCSPASELGDAVS